MLVPCTQLLDETDSSEWFWNAVRETLSDLRESGSVRSQIGSGLGAFVFSLSGDIIMSRSQHPVVW